MRKMVLLGVVPLLRAARCSQGACGLSFQQDGIKYVEVLWRKEGLCTQLPSFWCLSSEEKESKRTSVLRSLERAQIVPLRTVKAKHWCVLSLRCGVLATLIFHYRFISHLFTYISSSF